MPNSTSQAEAMSNSTSRAEAISKNSQSRRQINMIQTGAIATCSVNRLLDIIELHLSKSVSHLENSAATF